MRWGGAYLAAWAWWLLLMRWGGAYLAAWAW